MVRLVNQVCLVCLALREVLQDGGEPDPIVDVGRRDAQQSPEDRPVGAHESRIECRRALCAVREARARPQVLGRRLRGSDGARGGLRGPWSGGTAQGLR